MRSRSSLAAYDLALQYDAQSVFAHMNAAGVLARQGRSAEALQHLEQAANIAPQDAEIRFQFGAYLKSLGRLEQAQTQLAAAVDLQPDHAGAQKLLAEIRQFQH